MHKIICKQSVAFVELILILKWGGGGIVTYPEVFQLFNDAIGAHH